MCLEDLATTDTGEIFFPENLFPSDCYLDLVLKLECSDEPLKYPGREPDPTSW